MIGPLYTITRNTFTESIRQPIFVVLTVVGGIALSLNLKIAQYTFTDDTKLMIDIGMSMIVLCAMLLSSLLASGVITREIENKTVLTVISKPIGRPIFIVSKFFGVAGAVSVAMFIWSIVFLLTVRHKVISAASDPIDWPVIVFGFSALICAAGVAVWCNFFYRWVFNSTFITLLCVFLALAYTLVLMINKQWEFQPITTEFLNAEFTNYSDEEKSLGQIILAIGLLFEIAWLTCAIAIAASTRLGQVMTLLACTITLSIGMTSDALLGRYADSNLLAEIAYAIVPNFNQLYMTDALTQGSAMSLQYVLMASGYAALFIAAALALAVALFQTRETG